MSNLPQMLRIPEMKYLNNSTTEWQEIGCL